MASIKLVSLNVERRRHVDVVENFLARQNPDVVCFQELAEADVDRFKNAIGAASHRFVPMTRELELGGSTIVHGLGIFSRVPLMRVDAFYYVGEREHLPDTQESKPNSFSFENRILLIGDLEKAAKTFRVGTTHFTWTKEGKATDLQREHLRKLLDLLKDEKLVLCGDFNAPRGGEIFSRLTARFKDNIPAHYTSSLDPLLHRAAPLELMVDGLFTTAEYTASNVELISGLSDHKAIVATISKDN